MKRHPATGRVPIECEHGFDCCPKCDAIAKLTPRQRAYKRIVAEMGRKGGKASAAALTPEQRQARASAAGKASAAAMTPKQRKERARRAGSARRRARTAPPVVNCDEPNERTKP